ncbi:unnamed protein product [Danaus chrysippus]|uniref:(African queen) hypothetical protein n=1 Tax=Danaus chrysippus TaxID=151541 RepID=A0A8J2VRT7_9NEOP|nr:unnamed protein product [Danaus chrysippus]
MAASVRVLLQVVVVVFGVTHAFVDEAVDVLKLGVEIGEEVLQSWDVIGKQFNSTGGVELPIIKRRERMVLAKLADISKAIQRLEIQVERNGVVAMLLARASNRGARLELRLHELGDLLSRVTSADRQMREYVRLQRELERITLEDFAEWCVSHDPGALPGLLERVHSLIAPPYRHLLGGGGILHMILSDLQVRYTLVT